MLNDAVVETTPTEFALLCTLVENLGHAFTRGELIEKALGYSYEGLERRVDSHFKNLRKKGVATVAVLVNWPVVTTAICCWNAFILAGWGWESQLPGLTLRSLSTRF